MWCKWIGVCRNSNSLSIAILQKSFPYLSKEQILFQQIVWAEDKNHGLTKRIVYFHYIFLFKIHKVSRKELRRWFLSQCSNHYVYQLTQSHDARRASCNHTTKVGTHSGCKGNIPRHMHVIKTSNHSWHSMYIVVYLWCLCCIALCHWPICFSNILLLLKTPLARFYTACLAVLSPIWK